MVKGVQFENIRDAGDPVEIARRYDEQGAGEITFLDITASVDNRDTTLHTVERMASQVFIPLTVGGGVRTVQDIRNLLNAGADKVSINTAAVFNRTSSARPRTVLARSASWSPSTPRRSLRQASRAAGKSSPTAAASPPGWTRLNGRRRWKPSAPARSCSPAWTRTV